MTSDFYRRWGIEISDAERTKKMSVQLSILVGNALNKYYQEEEFRRQLSLIRGIRYISDNFLDDLSFPTEVFSSTKLGKELESCSSIPELAKLIEDTLNCLYNFQKKKRIVLPIAISDAAKIAHDISNFMNQNEVRPFFIQVSNDRFHTLSAFNSSSYNEVTSRVLIKFSNYPKLHEHLINALKFLLSEGNIRGGLDEIRLTLELFMKERLQTSQNLNSLKNLLSNEIISLNITEEGRRFYMMLFSGFDKYQNENVKHNYSGISQREAEFIFFQALALIEFLA